MKPPCKQITLTQKDGSVESGKIAISLPQEKRPQDSHDTWMAGVGNKEKLMREPWQRNDRAKEKCLSVAASAPHVQDWQKEMAPSTMSDLAIS